ncbi:MAG: histidine kinase [Clostridia bacterium]|nr:histidine kinase [Clostridia bacterium]
MIAITAPGDKHNMFSDREFRFKFLLAAVGALLVAALITAAIYAILRSGWVAEAQNRSIQLGNTIEQRLQNEDDLLALQITSMYASAPLMNDILDLFRSKTSRDYLDARLRRSRMTSASIRSFPEYIRAYIHRYRSSLYQIVLHGEDATHILSYSGGELAYAFDAPFAPQGIQNDVAMQKAIYNPAGNYEKIGEVSFLFRTSDIVRDLDFSAFTWAALTDGNGNVFELKNGSNPKAIALERVALIQDFSRFSFQLVTFMDDAAMIRSNFPIPLILVAVMLTLSAISISFLAHVIRFTIQRKQHIQTEFQLKIQQQQAEMRMLQSQINPHFLYNTLEAISSQALLNKNRPVADAITALGSLFRQMTNLPSHISMKDEMDILRTYLRVMEIKCAGSFCYQVELEPDLEKFQTVKFWLQPLAENFFSHGYDLASPYNLLIVRCYKDNRAVCIDLLDNGQPIPEERLALIHDSLSQPEKADGGIGLRNVHSRLNLFYGGGVSITVSNSEEGGVIVRVRIHETATKGGQQHV